MTDDLWTCKDTINVLIGIASSILTAYIYELLVNYRKERKDETTFGFLSSPRDKFDWQHYSLINGSIGEPVESYMSLDYSKDKIFLYRWIEGGQSLAVDEKPTGSGTLYWKNLSYGKLFYHEYLKNNFNHRNVFYAVVSHDNKQYDAIFVNADDEGTKYAMLRLVSLRATQHTFT